MAFPRVLGLGHLAPTTSPATHGPPHGHCLRPRIALSAADEPQATIMNDRLMPIMERQPFRIDSGPRSG